MPLPEDTALRPLEVVLHEGLPDPPIDNLDERVADLDARLAQVRREKERRDEALEGRADSLLGAAEERLAELEGRLAKLERLAEGFGELGPLGESGLADVEGTLEPLRAYHERLRAFVAEPTLAPARDRRRRAREEARRLIEERLDTDAPVETIRRDLHALTSILQAEELELAIERVEALEPEGDSATDWPAASGLEEELQRFWNRVRLLAAGRDALLEAHADTWLERLAPILDRSRQRSENSAEAQRLFLEIEAGLRGLEQLGPHEREAQLNVWLGKLRRLQDDCELDEQAREKVYHGFGAINTWRSDNLPNVYFYPLNRRHHEDWTEFIKRWVARLPEAREQDEEERAEARRQEARDAERAREAEAERTRNAKRLLGIVEDLHRLGERPLDDISEDGRDEILDLLGAGIDAGGAEDEAFVRAAEPFARLVARGGDFRRLRRVLKRYGVDFDTIDPIESPNASEQLFAPYRARWQGKCLALVGGLPRPDRRERIENALDLEELRWYEAYRDHAENDRAVEALRAGSIDGAIFLLGFTGHHVGQVIEVCKAEGVPFARVERGCGESAVLRGLERLDSG